MDRALLVRRIGGLAPIIGALTAAASVVCTAYYVDRSGCVGYEFDCVKPTGEALLTALIVSVPVSIGALWLSVLTAADAAASIRQPGSAFWRAVVGGVAWVLLSIPAALWLVIAAGENAIPQSDAQVDGQALARAAVAVAFAVGLFGLAAAAAVRRGWRMTGLLTVAAFFAFFVGCVLPGHLK